MQQESHHMELPAETCLFFMAAIDPAVAGLIRVSIYE